MLTERTLFCLFEIYMCVLLLDIFNGCSLVQLKKISWLVNKQVNVKQLKVTSERNWRSWNSHFLKLSLCQFLLSSNLCRYHWILKLPFATLEVWDQNCLWLSYYFNFERNYNVLKSKSPCILLEKTLLKNKTELKMENCRCRKPQRWTLYLIQLI